MPFWIPLAAAAATTIGNEIQRGQRERRFNRSRPPAIDFGRRRSEMVSGAGELRNQQVAGYGESQAARGVNDPGAAFSAARGANMDMARQVQSGMLSIQDQEDAYNRAVAEWEARKAEQPDFMQSLGEGIQTGMNVYQMMNPEQFTAEYPEVKAPAQTPTIDFAPKLNATENPFIQNGYGGLGGMNPNRSLQPGIQTGTPGLRFGTSYRGMYQLPEQRIIARRPQVQFGRSWSPARGG